MIMLATALIIAPATAFATGGFDDVDESDFFSDAVAWMKDNGVTVGCNPPSNTRYCPDDFVTRGQMAVFMQRLDTKDVFLRPGDVPMGSGGGDADTLDGKDSTDFLGKTQKAADADKVDGLDVGCPDGTSLVAGVCIETSLRPADNVFNAMRICGTADRRLGTAAELGAYRGAGNSLAAFETNGELTSVIHNEGSFQVLTVRNAPSAGEVSIAVRGTNSDEAFRCVTGPVG